VNHLILLGTCILSIEIFIRSKYILLLNSIMKLSKKATYIILNKNISDHWKEKIIPQYSIQIMKCSWKMLFILLLIIFIFGIANNLFSGFLEFLFSWNGIIKSILIAFSYGYIRKLSFK